MVDAIIVGARCGGSPPAMNLARAGHNVLVVDRAHFPSDTLSPHALTGSGPGSGPASVNYFTQSLLTDQTKWSTI
jgi:flavin-dependent dehydrogenase